MLKFSWLRCTVVETPVFDQRTFPVPCSTCSWRVHKTSTIGQPTRPTQHFILSWSINWVLSWSRCVPPCSDDAIWWMLTKWMQDGSFHSWINVWVPGKTVWTLCHLARSSRWSLFVECKRWTDCIEKLIAIKKISPVRTDGRLFASDVSANFKWRDTKNWTKYPKSGLNKFRYCALV